MNPTAKFAFVCCHQGAESPLKQGVAAQGWRLAYSRPGFVSFKHQGESAEALPAGPFARTASWSIGRTEAEHSRELADKIAEIVQQTDAFHNGAGPPLDVLHLWQRDRLPVGEKGFEPHVDAWCECIAEDVSSRLSQQELLRSSSVNRSIAIGESALDVVSVDPGKWMIGWHLGTALAPSRWAGGYPPINMNAEVVSRAYFKAAEAILWSGFAMSAGDTVVEIGSAPGGAAQRLLELDLHVIGVDPAEMDPEIAEHPNFEHIRARGGDIKRQHYANAKWLMVDSNVRPDKTLVTVQNIVSHRQVNIRGMLLTMKLGRYDQADRIGGWCQQIRGWGFPKINVRQLTTGRCEVCIAASKED